ncbi:MAG: hypothetical protein ACFUZC_18445 [Chthoniobacteraceae bacterium]
MYGIAAISDLNQTQWAQAGTATLLAFIVGLLGGLGVSALLLRVFVRVLFGYWPSWLNALWTVFCLVVATVALRLGINFGFGSSGTEGYGILILVIQLAVQALIIGLALEHPDTGRLGFSRAIGLMVAEYAVGFCLGLAVWKFAPIPEAERGRILAALQQRQNAVTKATTAPAFLQVAPAVTAPKTVDEAQREAVRRYPALAVAGSAFNREFRSRYDSYRKSNPKYFLETNWPISLAEETNGALKSR